MVHSLIAVSCDFVKNNESQWTLFIDRSSRFIRPSGTVLALISLNSNTRQGLHSFYSSPNHHIMSGYFTDREEPTHIIQLINLHSEK